MREVEYLLLLEALGGEATKGLTIYLDGHEVTGLYFNRHGRDEPYFTLSNACRVEVDDELWLRVPSDEVNAASRDGRNYRPQYGRHGEALVQLLNSARTILGL